MKYIISLFMLLSAGIAITSCSDELPVTGNSTSVFTPKGELVDAYLDLTVGSFSVNATSRADDEEETDIPDDDEMERQVDNLWVFQYDADGTLISEPQYITITDQTILKNVPAKLSNNDGEESIVYVVTNTNNDTWGGHPMRIIRDLTHLMACKHRLFPLLK